MNTREFAEQQAEIRRRLVTLGLGLVFVALGLICVSLAPHSGGSSRAEGLVVAAGSCEQGSTCGRTPEAVLLRVVRHARHHRRTAVSRQTHALRRVPVLSEVLGLTQAGHAKPAARAGRRA